MSTQNPLLTAAEQAAIPTAINALEALQQFETDMGPNPLQWVANYPGARLKLLGTIALQLPALATSEGGAVVGIIGNVTAGWISTLKAAQSAGAAPSPQTT